MVAVSCGPHAVNNSSPAENLTSNRLSGRRAGRQSATTPVSRSSKFGAGVPATGRVFAGAAGLVATVGRTAARPVAAGRCRGPTSAPPGPTDDDALAAGSHSIGPAQASVKASVNESKSSKGQSSSASPVSGIPLRTRSSAAAVATRANCRWASASTSRYSSPSGRASEKISANSLTFRSTSRTSGSNCPAR